MEHEDNHRSATQHLDNNYLHGSNFEEFSLQQNQQNLVENLQIAGGFGAGGLVGAVDEIGVGVVGSIGGKFEEAEHDDEEWKYIKEVQQSEKQTLRVAEEAAAAAAVVGVGNDDDNDDDGAVVLLAKYEAEENGEEYPDEVEEWAAIKNDGDFSTTSTTTTSTNGAEEGNSAAEEMHHQQQQLPVDMEIASELHQTQAHISPATIAQSSMASSENCENPQQQQLEEDMFAAHSLQHKSNNYYEEEEAAYAEYKYEADKENADPTVAAVAAAAVNDLLEDNDDNSAAAVVANTNPFEQQRPTELDFEMHSNLNPEAKEFVPVFSNPASPTSPMQQKDFDFLSDATAAPITLEHDVNASPIDFGVGVEQNIINNDFAADDADILAAADDDVGEPALSRASPHPTAVPRHMIGSAAADDVVAQSPRKGARGFNMDAIALPAEIEFEHEAAKRPHEIEQEDDLIGAGNIEQTEQQLEQMENGEDSNMSAALAADAEHMQMPAVAAIDLTDFQNAAPPVSHIDHGPETSVDLDLDMDVNGQQEDLMKQSIYVENVAAQHECATEQPIEELLNTVQPIPTDSESLNNSLIDEEEEMQLDEEQLVVPHKELLHVEEKEHISHSPSTEDIDYDNVLSNNHKNLQDMPIDMEAVLNAANEQLHFHKEEDALLFTDSEQQQQQENIFQNDDALFSQVNQDMPIDMNNAAHMQESFYMENTSHEALEAAANNAPVYNIETSSEELAQLEQNLLADTTNPLQTLESIEDNNVAAGADLLVADMAAHELATEKHLMEETKEEPQFYNDDMQQLEQQMCDLQMQSDGALPKVEDVAFSATQTIDKDQIAAFDDFTQENETAFATSPLPEQMLLEQHPADFEVEEQKLSAAYDTAFTAEAASFEPELLPESYAPLATEPQSVIQEDPFAVSAPVLDTMVSEFSSVAPAELQSEQLQDSLFAEEQQEIVSQSVFEEQTPSAPVDEPALQQEELIIAASQEELIAVAHQEQQLSAVAHQEVFSAEEQEELIRGVSQVESVPAAPQEELIPVASQEVLTPAPPQEELIPAASQDEPIPAATLEEQLSVTQLEEQPPAAPIEEPLPTATQEILEAPAAPISTEPATTELTAAAVAVTAAVAATAVAAVAAATPITKKTDASKKSTTDKVTPASAKPKVGAVSAKKPTPGTTARTATAAATARPRTAPSASAATRTTATTERKTTVGSTAAKPSATAATTARKPLSASSTAAKTATSAAGARSATTTSRPATVGHKPIARTTATTTTAAAARAATATTAARKPATSATTAAKPRTTASSTTAAAAKPSTIGVAAKPKVTLSPRSTLTSQVRKSAPTTTATAAAKSPNKPAGSATTTNGSARVPTAASNAATRTKTSTISTTTKTFSARPAPKSTSTTSTTTTSSTTATSRRTTLGGSVTSSSTSARTSSTLLRKTSPTKPLSAAAATGKISPNKPAPISRNKTKDAAPKPITKPGVANGAGVDKLKSVVEPPKSNGDAGEPHLEPMVHMGNGENGAYTADNNVHIEQAELALVGDGEAAA